MSLKFSTKLRGVEGIFGWQKENQFSSTFALNEKGGMTDDEFDKYVMTNLTCLYPDSADVEGHQVILKVYSGPGRMNERVLGKLRARGFYLYPGVPNTTAVSQETDISCGYFKSLF